MSDSITISLHEAAHQLDLPVRVLRRAIRSGAVTASGKLGATAPVPVEWLANVQTVIDSDPKAFRRGGVQKVPAFARYVGTSAWRKYANRVREYNHFRTHTAV